MINKVKINKHNVKKFKDKIIARRINYEEWYILTLKKYDARGQSFYTWVPLSPTSDYYSFLYDSIEDALYLGSKGELYRINAIFQYMCLDSQGDLEKLKMIEELEK